MIFLRQLIAATSLAAAGLLAAHGAPPSGSALLAGKWKLDLAKSTNLGAWTKFGLEISVDGPRITIVRSVSAEDRAYTQTSALDLSKPESIVPINWWIDNRNIGAYIGGDKTAKVHARLEEGGRVLHTDSDLTLSSQQGNHDVNVIADYHVSPNGQRLTILEIRSTRDLPVVYVFERAP